MVANAQDLVTSTYNSANPNVARVNGTRVPSGSSLSCDNLAGWPTVSGVKFSTYKIDTNNAVIPGTQIDWKGTVSGNTIGNLTRITGAADGGSAIGDVVEMNPTASWADDLYKGFTAQHKQLDGAHGAITADSAVITSATITNLTVGSQTPSADWTAIGGVPNTITYNGQRSYSLVFNGVDYTNILSPGQRLKTTRTVAAPTQCTSLNGTTQYWSKATPNKFSFTNNFVIDSDIKPSSYALGTIASTYNGTSGWALRQLATGQIEMACYNAGAANFFKATSYQSVALTKHSRVTSQVDMTVTTNTPTTNYIMIDGADVPLLCTRGGTNPTALIQAGNLNIGAENGGTNPFPGKIAQVAIYNAKVTQANIILTHSQGLSGSETSLASAYSFNGVATDLNTTTPNDLTAQGSAVATNADSPFGTQASGLISSTLDYGIVQSAVFSTNTTVVVQVPEGCTIPTSGGVSAVSYSGLKAPYGFPGQKTKWNILTNLMTDSGNTSNATYGAYLAGGYTINVPVGSWDVGQIASGYTSSTTMVTFNLSPVSLAGQNITAGKALSDLVFSFQTPSAAVCAVNANTRKSVTLATATTYTVQTIGATALASLQGNVNLNCLFAENAYL